jgi:type II secretory pathway component PulK
MIITTQTHSLVCQRGAALFMALVILLVMTILGVFGMNISRMENLMAGNNQFQTAALSNAELILAVGEKKTEDILGNLPFADWNETGDAYYDRTSESAELINPHALNWGFDYQAEDSSSRYVIEYAGSELIPGNDASVEGTSTCTAGSCVWVFLATAQNETSRGAKRTVQSVYVTETPP